MAVRTVVDTTHVRVAITDRLGGVSHAPFDALNLATHVGDDALDVARNRSVVADALGFADASLRVMNQVHSPDVQVVTADAISDEVPRVDALVTTDAGLWLTAMAADCVPVALYDDEHQVVGAVHAGWRGVVGGVLTNAVSAMRDQGAEVHSLRAFVGPAICGRCYEVGPEVFGPVTAIAPQAAAQTRQGTTGVDLVAAVREQLIQLGFAPDAVDVDGRCTFEDDVLYSYRRSGGTATGRHALLVSLR